MQIDICEEITALVDGEVSDFERADELLHRINSDTDLAFEKFIQVSIKTVLNKKVFVQATPDYLPELIKKRIQEINTKL